MLSGVAGGGYDSIHLQSWQSGRELWEPTSCPDGTKWVLRRAKPLSDFGSLEMGLELRGEVGNKWATNRPCWLYSLSFTVEADAFPRQLLLLLLLLFFFFFFFFFFFPFLACERTGQTLKLNSFFGCCTGVRLEAGITKLFPLKSRPFAKFFAVLELKQRYHAKMPKCSHVKTCM